MIYKISHIIFVIPFCISIQMIQVAGILVPSFDKSSYNRNTNNDVVMMTAESGTRILTLPNEYVAALSTTWWNWNFCTNAYLNESFTPMNSLVPDNILFLAGYPTNQLDNNSLTCQSMTITRVANISVGTQTIIYPLVNHIYADNEDDYELGLCANNTNQTLQRRLAEADELTHWLTSESFIMSLYSTIDRVPVTPTYIDTREEKYFQACPDNATKTSQEYATLFGAPEGDECDIDPYQIIDGMDAYPSLGWYGIDTRTWINGETHIYEFGSTTVCITAKYVRTAVSNETITTTTDETAKQPTSGGGSRRAAYNVRIVVLLIIISCLNYMFALVPIGLVRY